MTSTDRFRLLLTCTMFAILSGAGGDVASAQFPGMNAFEGGLPGNVAGTGVVKIEKQPTIMRMKLDLFAKGSSMKEALANLEDRKKSARKQVEDLGAEVKSIAIGTASVSKAQSDQQQQQMSMMLDMLNERRGRQPKAKPPKISVPITVTCSLKAEWKLTAETPGELLEFAHPLQQKIRDSDISGAKDATALSPEQQELVEEMGNEYGSNRYSSSDETQPGTPAFLFAAAVSEEEQDQALAEAFQKAKTKAARLSKATGMSLGKLVSVSSNESRGPEANEYSAYYGGGYYGSAMESIQALMDEENSANEAVGIEPGVVKATVTVTARFDFKQAGN